MTIIETQAFEAILAHHRSLTEGVAQRVGALSKAVAEDGRYQPVVAELITFLAEEVLPHASAEEPTIYQAAKEKGDLARTVREMSAEHRRLADLTEALASASDGPSALELASTIGSLFAAHVDRENDVVLPHLQAQGADLAALLGRMHGLIEEAKQGKATSPAPPAAGTESDLLALLLDAAGALAAGGQGDRACRTVASAWALLRAPRPDLAVRVTAALHKLARSVTAVPVSFSSGRGESAKGDGVLDVRDMAPAQRHEVIFATYSALAPGTGFVLVNDHDPKPLYYQFEAEHAGQFSWDYLEAGPRVWRVRIGRPEAGQATWGQAS